MFRRFNLFSSCLTKPSKTSEPIIWVFWDCDGTLFNIPQNILEKQQFAKLKHLTEVAGPNNFSVFMIYLAKTQEVFRALLVMKNVRLAFITTAEYDTSTLTLLETALELGKDALKDSVFINRYVFEHIDRKGEKLHQFRRTGMIGPQDHVILVDNLQYQVDSARDYGFEAILAEGYCQEAHDNGDVITYHPNNNYLNRIIELVRSKVQELVRQEQTKELGFTVTHSQIVVRPDFS